MIRRDYILRMIEEFIQVLARINALKKDHRWHELIGTWFLARPHVLSAARVKGQR